MALLKRTEELVGDPFLFDGREERAGVEPRGGGWVGGWVWEGGGEEGGLNELLYRVVWVGNELLVYKGR